MDNHEDFPKELRRKLDEFHVTTPEIPLKRSLSDRMANTLFAPCQNPLDHIDINAKGLTVIQILPVGLTLFLSLGMFFII